VCEDGTSLRDTRLKKGFWRHSVDAMEALECPKFISGEKICLGGPWSTPTTTMKKANNESISDGMYCLSGHTGPFCSQCRPGYGKKNDICDACRNGAERWVDWMYISFALLAVLGLCVVIIRGKMNANPDQGTNPKQKRSRASIVEREQAIAGFTSKVKIVINCAYACAQTITTHASAWPMTPGITSFPSEIVR